MGTWGTGTLENDSAQDFFAVIFEINFKSLKFFFSKERFLLANINSVLENTDFYQETIAACEAIAAAHGKANPQLNEDYIQISLKCKNRIDNKIVTKAIIFLNEIEKDEEALDGWLSEESKVEWLNNISDLKKRLKSIS